MPVWLIRAGSHGEYERKFLQEGRVYLTWENLAENLGRFPDRAAILAATARLYPDAKPRRLQNWASQIWSFAHEIKEGDLVILPLKRQPAICIGEVTGDYKFEGGGPDPFFHWRCVKWIADAVPRAHFGKDLLFSFGAFLTICRIQRNSAEARLAAMRASNWEPETLVASITTNASVIDEAGEETDLQELARDQIARLISSRFKGHGLARLVEGILKAQGYTTYCSPEGPDDSVDIVAGAGPLGFGSPRLCVQVKSQDTPVESKELNELRGAMQRVRATEGLFVSWGGFKTTIQRHTAESFFAVRLWTQRELLEALFAHYDQLGDDLKAELPLKRFWTVALPDEE